MQNVTQRSVSILRTACSGPQTSGSCPTMAGIFKLAQCQSTTASICLVLWWDSIHLDSVNNTRTSHVWPEMNPRTTVESNFQLRFGVCVVWYSPQLVDWSMYLRRSFYRLHLSRVSSVRHLHDRFPGWWIGHGAQNWPVGSPDLNPPLAVCDELVYNRKVTTRDALPCCILDTTTHMKGKCNELMRPTRAIHRRAEMCTKATGGHFEQIL